VADKIRTKLATAQTSAGALGAGSTAGCRRALAPWSSRMVGL